MKDPNKTFLALLIEAKYPDKVAKKISKFETLKSETINTSHIVGNQFITSTEEMDAIAGLIVAYLNQKHNVNMDFDEYETFRAHMLTSIKAQEKKIKALKELAPQDRYRD